MVIICLPIGLAMARVVTDKSWRYDIDRHLGLSGEELQINSVSVWKRWKVLEPLYSLPSGEVRCGRIHGCDGLYDAAPASIVSARISA